MKQFFEILLIVLGALLYQIIVHSEFSVCLSDDIEFRYGKKHLRNFRRKSKDGFLKRYLFLDVRKKVVRWHYVFFWIHLVAFFPTLIFFILFAVYELSWARIVFLIFEGIRFFCAARISFVRWDLYKGNTVRCRKDRRKYRR